MIKEGEQRGKRGITRGASSRELPQPLKKLPHTQGRYRIFVERQELLEIELGITLVDTIQGEVGGEEIIVEPLQIVAGVPAQQGEVIAKHFGEEPQLPEVPDIDRPLRPGPPFGHFGAVGVEDEAEVGVGGTGKAEGGLQEDVLGGVAQVFLCTEHVGNAHRGIIDDDGEVVGGEAVGFANDEVLGLSRGDGDVAADFIVESDGFVRDFEADRPVEIGRAHV